MEAFRAELGIRDGHEWDLFEGIDGKAAKAMLRAVPFNAAGRRRYRAEKIAVPATLPMRRDDETSTQTAFGRVLDEIARDKESPLAVTCSPEMFPLLG